MIKGALIFAAGGATGLILGAIFGIPLGYQSAHKEMRQREGVE